MNAAFIIAEYNPFHTGHEYHIKTTRRELSPDAIVCVMSGNFTQRGSAAIVDKWARARMALAEGADLVLELHPVYACSSAEGFASGALKTAAGLGAGGWLSFGAECADIELLNRLSNVAGEEPELYKTLLGASLTKGKSFAAARQDALTGYLAKTRRAQDGGAVPGADNPAQVIKASNNILAIEYLKANKSLRNPFAPYAVKRTGNIRASAVRDTIRTEYMKPARYGFSSRDDYPSNGDFSSHGDFLSGLDGLLPSGAETLLAAEFEAGRGPIFDDAFFRVVRTIIIRDGADALRGFADVSEGLENRLYKAARSACSYGELIDLAGTRRYPDSRLRRVLTRVLLGFSKSVFEKIKPENGPPYLRVLGFTAAGRRLLAAARPELPVIANYKALRRSDRRSREFMRLEAAATDIYVTAYQNAAFRACGQDFTRGVVGGGG